MEASVRDLKPSAKAHYEISSLIFDGIAAILAVPKPSKKVLAKPESLWHVAPSSLFGNQPFDASHAFQLNAPAVYG